MVEIKRGKITVYLLYTKIGENGIVSDKGIVTNEDIANKWLELDDRNSYSLFEIDSIHLIKEINASYNQISNKNNKEIVSSFKLPIKKD